PGRFVFPRPMTNRPGFDFSFSGLKTATLTVVREHSRNNEIDARTKADIAHAFQEAVVDTLVIKCRRAMLHTGMPALVIAGGVSANTRLREQLGAMAAAEHGKLYYPRLEYCTDNGAMIAFAGCQ